MRRHTILQNPPRPRTSTAGTRWASTAELSIRDLDPSHRGYGFSRTLRHGKSERSDVPLRMPTLCEAELECLLHQEWHAAQLCRQGSLGRFPKTHRKWVSHDRSRT